MIPWDMTITDSHVPLGNEHKHVSYAVNDVADSVTQFKHDTY